MFPLYDDKNKKIFFWSYKCGCTFVREIFYNYYLKLNCINFDRINKIFNCFYKINLLKIIIKIFLDCLNNSIYMRLKIYPINI